MVTTVVRTERFFLVGFMGTGKTTLGRRVAERMELPFFDLDGIIEKATGRSVSRIFAEQGEAAFRRLESESLHALVAGKERGVVATGGGAFTLPDNRRLMMSRGVVIWLDVPAEEIVRRIGPKDRPLWTNPDEALRLYELRRPVYAEAHHRLALENRTPEESALELYRILSQYRSVP